MKNFILLITMSLLSFSASADFSNSSTCAAAPANGTISAIGSYYAWGVAQNGFGYCYQWAGTGQVLNGGQPQPNYLCEQRSPSYFTWGPAQNGYGYCYHYTGNGLVMDLGQPQANYNCEMRYPSHYAWGRAQNGYTYCYQYTPSGLVMNAGAPVNNYLCQ